MLSSSSPLSLICLIFSTFIYSNSNNSEGEGVGVWCGGVSEVVNVFGWGWGRRERGKFGRVVEGRVRGWLCSEWVSGKVRKIGG